MPSNNETEVRDVQRCHFLIVGYAPVLHLALRTGLGNTGLAPGVNYSTLKGEKREKAVGEYTVPIIAADESKRFSPSWLSLQAVLHSEQQLLARVWRTWQQKTVAHLEDQQEVSLAKELYRHQVLRAMFHLWKANVQEIQKG